MPLLPSSSLRFVSFFLWLDFVLELSFFCLIFSNSWSLCLLVSGVPCLGQLSWKLGLPSAETLFGLVICFLFREIGGLFDFFLFFVSCCGGSQLCPRSCRSELLLRLLWDPRLLVEPSALCWDELRDSLWDFRRGIGPFEFERFLIR